ncbi:urease accessory protein UreF [Thalassobius sp. Cn5-15]|uniref:urease accessory protein UreF n=1 Tax=Thalassobius sp. Cn5-15 TaxID=2917763 RepID=UPI001EF26561|nr:urease accessory protein UreF [Thalassobius sp. Cn5-15]MCG7494882.1 urease accessory protein UreF [Thalassobius sp. Cn5-15]
MLTNPQLLTLTQWLSPAYPIGAFSYSHGLEWAVEAGQVRDADSFAAWLSDILERGSGRNDVILMAAAYAAAPEELEEVDEIARAFAASRERLLETESQGAAFAKITDAIWGDMPTKLTYPVALGFAAARQDMPLTPVAAMYLHAFASNLCAAAMRLVPLGQTDGNRVLHTLAPLCERVTKTARQETLDDLGGACVLAEIASMKHETQYTRLFRT